MRDVSFHQFLVLYSWFTLAALLLFVFFIARFYQRFSGITVYYRFYLVAAAILGVAAVRIAGVNRLLGDPVADLLSAVAGGLLLLLVVRLYRRMLAYRSVVDE